MWSSTSWAMHSSASLIFLANEEAAADAFATHYLTPHLPHLPAIPSRTNGRRFVACH